MVVRAIAILALAFAVGEIVNGDELPEATVSFRYNDVSWAMVLEALSKFLDASGVIGEIPDCRVTIQFEDLTLFSLIQRFNQVYGIAFVETADRSLIFLPADKERLCLDWIQPETHASRSASSEDPLPNKVLQRARE